MNKSKPDTLVVMPTYCERENIANIIPVVLDTMDVHILVVDDESPDGTGDLADDMAEKDQRVSVLHRRGAPRGLGCAYKDGFEKALDMGARFIVQMDADFSHDPAELARLRAAAESADLVIGSRYVPGGSTPGWSLPRRIISAGGSLYARTVLGLRVRDLTGGFKCWRAGALRRCDPRKAQSKGFAFQIEMNFRASRAGLRIQEVPIRFVDRTRGESKMSARIFIEGLVTVWKIRMGSHE